MKPAVTKRPRLSTEWRTSSRSAIENCLQARFISGCVEVRDSKDPDGGTLTIAPEQWKSFVAFACEAGPTAS